MAITHKGISMLLKHHALDVADNSDDDVKNCVDAAIKNSDDAMPEESGSDDSDSVPNRDEALDALTARVEAAEAKNAELEAKLKAKPAPIHNRTTAKEPNIDLDTVEDETAEDIERQAKISNRATELEKQGVPAITAYNRAAKQFAKKTTDK